MYGHLTPIHLSGGCSAGSGGGQNSEARRPENYTWGSRSSYAAPTRCPECHASIYFIRHNGGCVWLDALGWPWPKHGCFVKEREPNWAGFIREKLSQPNHISDKASIQSAENGEQDRFFVGVIVEVRAKFNGPERFIALAVEGSYDKKMCVAVPEDRAPISYMDCLVVIDQTKKTLASSNHRFVDLLNTPIKPSDLDLPENWLDSSPNGAPQHDTSVAQK